ncbi:MAG: hypothetical protein S0880_27715 [Actinomycetota bacterium]|nr:hypothetical protein [Actinomycetota bacterium]
MAVHDTRPDELHLSVGSADSDTYVVELVGDDLVWRRISPQGQQSDPIALQPGDDWKAFSVALDEIGVWGWDASYSAADGGDGTQWRVHVTWGDDALISSGHGVYPPGWVPFSAAVGQLLDGLEFG